MRDLPEIDGELAVAYLLRFLAVEGTTGDEGAIGKEIAAALGELGVPAGAMRYDDCPSRIPLPTPSGNLVVDLEGDARLPRRLFIAHRDTVPLCAGAVPERTGERVVSAAPTALGGDNRTGVACLVHLVAVLRRSGLRHPPLTLLFTVREESGLWGARCVDLALLGQPALGFNVDGPSPSRLVLGAAGAAGWEAEIRGRAAHAGLHPEHGISAARVAARALAAIDRRGWWGRVRRGGREGTANVGRLAGRDGGAVGGATNVVTDYALIAGEARSHDQRFIDRIVAAHGRAFESAAAAVRSASGETATVEFRSRRMYDPFRLSETSEVARFALERSERAGLRASFAIADGGLDANWMVRHGVPTVTFGAGQRGIHALGEAVDLPDYLDACRLAVALAAVGDERRRSRTELAAASSASIAAATSASPSQGRRGAGGAVSPTST